MTDLNLPHPLRAVEEKMEEVVGGPARVHVVLVLACVLALNTADQATVGAAGVTTAAAGTITAPAGLPP